jgi:hypothetical protein
METEKTRPEQEALAAFQNAVGVVEWEHGVREADQADPLREGLELAHKMAVVVETARELLEDPKAVVYWRALTQALNDLDDYPTKGHWGPGVHGEGRRYHIRGITRA